MTLATVLVLFIIAVELYRPIIIGNAIDQYINGYYHPYVEADVSASDAVNWNGLVLSRDQAVSKADSASFYQIFLWKDHYYMAENSPALMYCTTKCRYICFKKLCQRRCTEAYFQ